MMDIAKHKSPYASIGLLFALIVVQGFIMITQLPFVWSLIGSALWFGSTFYLMLLGKNQLWTGMVTLLIAFFSPFIAIFILIASALTGGSLHIKKKSGF